MTMRQSDASILRVVRGKGGFWEVRAPRLEGPLFNFRKKRDAERYAEDIAEAHPGISVEVCAENEQARGAGDLSLWARPGNRPRPLRRYR